MILGDAKEKGNDEVRLERWNFDCEFATGG